MTFEELETLAENEGPLSEEETERKLAELKAAGWTILLCIGYVWKSRQCSRTEAKMVVTTSKAWEADREAFLKHQDDVLNEAALEDDHPDHSTKYNRLYWLPKK